MNNKKTLPITFAKYTSVFCSIAVLSTYLHAEPSIQFYGDGTTDNLVTSGKLGYVGGNTRIGATVDRHLQGQLDLNQVLSEKEDSLTSADLWLGYKLKTDDYGEKGTKGGGVKLNHQWLGKKKDAVHKIFGAYDKNKEGFAKATVGYGQEKENIFWSGHLSKGLSDDKINNNITTRAYDYGIGGEVGTFLEDKLMRIRGGVDYEIGTDFNDSESRPSKLTVSGGIEKFFQNSPHSLSFDISGNKRSGGSQKDDTDYNVQIGYHFDFGNVFRSKTRNKKVRVKVPGTASIAAKSGVPAKYARKAVTVSNIEHIKTTMKLENETFFKNDSARLTSSAMLNLDKIAKEILNSNVVGIIRITGHASKEASFKHNLRLSQRRTKTVRDYLIAAGIKPHLLQLRSLGESSPKYNASFKNRRVDIEFVSERFVRKNVQRVKYKDVLIQAAIPGSPAVAGKPARYIWKTEQVKTAPTWIKRALHNPIRHNKVISTYSTKKETINGGKVIDDAVIANSARTTIDVLANDSNNLTLKGVTQPENGTVTIVNGKVVYTPKLGFSGIDTFTYSAVDSNGQIFTSAVNVTVPKGANEEPVAVKDEVIASVNTPILIDVLANDTDTNGDNISLVSVSSANHGAVKIVNGKIQYTPNDNFVGTDTFQYTIEDENGNQVTADVIVTVNNVNVAPAAVDDSVSTPENTAVTITPISNDNDPDRDAINIVAGSLTNPTNGSVSLNGNDIIYTPNNGFDGTDSFDYTITDPSGLTSTATVTVIVTNVNVAPVVVNDTALTYKNRTVAINVLVNDSDSDGDTISVVSHTNPAHGIIRLTDGVFTYTPYNNYAGADSFTYTVSDGNGHEVTATVNINVVNTNTAPVAQDDTVSIDENTAATITAISNDNDPDGDAINIVAGSLTNPANGSVSLNGNDIIYTPNNGFDGTDSFDYTITDPSGLTSTATVTVIVSNVNVAPAAVDDSVSTPENTAVTITPISNDNDPDGDAINIIAGSLTNPANGSVSLNGNDIVYTPNNGFDGTDSFDYTITDPSGLTSTATVTVTVNNVNLAPIAQDDTASTDENTAVAINVLTNDSDIDNDTLTIISNTNPSNGTVSLAGDVFTYTPNTDYVGTDSFTYTISDANGHEVTAVVTVTITTAVPNQDPVAVLDRAWTDMITPVLIDVLANDYDPDSNFIELVAITLPPSKGTAVIQGTQILYTPYSNASSDYLEYSIRDADGGTAIGKVYIGVGNP